MPDNDPNDAFVNMLRIALPVGIIVVLLLCCVCMPLVLRR